MRCALLVSCAVSALAYHASQPWVTQPADDDSPNLQLHRLRAGAVPIGWQWPPISEAPAAPTRKSVAQITEEQKDPEVRISYVHPTLVSEYRRYGYGGLPLRGFAQLRATGIKEHGSDTKHGPKWQAKYGDHARKWEAAKRLSQKRAKRAECWGKALKEGKCKPEPEAKSEPEGAGQTDWAKIEKERAEREQRNDPRDEAGQTDWAKIDWSGGAGEVDWSGKEKDPNGHGKKKSKFKDPRKTGISRCGFTWDDAAAKMGAGCSKDGGCNPSEETNNKDAYWHGHNYSCYTDLPDNGLTVGGRHCDAVDGTATPQWCTAFCNDASTYCDPHICDCEFDKGLNDTDRFQNEDAYNINAPIAEHLPTPPPEKMLRRSDRLREAVIRHGEAQPSGLPECTWRPEGHWEGMAPVWTKNGWTAGGTPVGCTNATQYECIAGEKRGECSAKNWFDESAQGKDKVCGASCVHVSLLRPAPYYALWYPGPLAKDFKVDERQPRYEHDPANLDPSPNPNPDPNPSSLFPARTLIPTPGTSTTRRRSRCELVASTCASPTCS